MRAAIVATLMAGLTGACAESTGRPAPSPTAPSSLTADANYAGEWAGGWRELSCEELPPRPGYCAIRVRDRDFSHVRLYLTQDGPRVSGRMQTTLGMGDVAGVVDDLGRLRLSGTVIFYDSPNRLAMRLLRTRLIADANRSLVGGLELEYVWDGPTPAAVVNAEMRPLQVRRCPGPNFTGLFWEC